MHKRINDFQGNTLSLDVVKSAKPDVINHNIETVKRLYSEVRPQADYNRSIQLLKYIKKGNNIKSKSGLIVGLGESMDEIKETLLDVKKADVDIITIGQYLAPSDNHYKIKKYYKPKEFEKIRNYAKKIGFKEVESGPLVRSSYHAESSFNKI